MPAASENTPDTRRGWLTALSQEREQPTTLRGRNLTSMPYRSRQS